MNACLYTHKKTLDHAPTKKLIIFINNEHFKI